LSRTDRLPEAFVAHEMPGRVRLKIPSRRNNNAYFEAVLGSLSQLSGVVDVEVNSSTASVLIIGSVTLPEIESSTKASHLFTVDRLPEKKTRKSIAVRLKNGVFKVNKRLSSITNGVVDIPSLFTVSFLAMGVSQILSGNFGLPAWYTALWYSLNMIDKSEK